MASNALDLFFYQLSKDPKSITFKQSIALIDDIYMFNPTAFTNGEKLNAANENTDACKILFFGFLHQLSESQTLSLFGSYYQDVLDNPLGDEHQNIREFMKTGWQGVTFKRHALIRK